VVPVTQCLAFGHALFDHPKPCRAIAWTMG
jgi:hypothetical protein